MTSPQDAQHVIVLTGPMGAGKSAIGLLLAETLQLPFIDSDAEIERRHAQTIAEIFATEGETGFRELERTVCVDLINQRDPPTIIALGGGAFIQDDVRNAAQQDHVKSIYLHTSPEASWSRIKNGTTHTRPLLAHPAPLQTLQNLYARRDPIYREAHLLIHTDELSPTEIVNRILAELA